MRLLNITKDVFFSMGISDINRIINIKKIPKVAVFVADGNSRIALIEAGVCPGGYFDFMIPYGWNQWLLTDYGDLEENVKAVAASENVMIIAPRPYGYETWIARDHYTVKYDGDFF